MPRVEPLTQFNHLYYVLENLRDADARERQATSQVDDEYEFAQHIVEAKPLAYMIYADDGEPVCAGGITPAWSGVGLLWAFATERWDEVALAAYRFTKRQLLPHVLAQGCHRIECRVMAANLQAVKWIESLGGRREAVMPGFGRHKEPFLLYSWIAPDVRPAADVALYPARRRSGLPRPGNGFASGLFH